MTGQRLDEVRRAVERGDGPQSGAEVLVVERPTSSPTADSAASPATWATSRSPPMPMASWIRTELTWRPTSWKAACHATTCW